MPVHFVFLSTKASKVKFEKLAALTCANKTVKEAQNLTISVLKLYDFLQKENKFQKSQICNFKLATLDLE